MCGSMGVVKGFQHSAPFQSSSDWDYNALGSILGPPMHGNYCIPM